MWRTMLAFCLLISQVLALQKYVNYGVDQQGVQLYRFFHDIQNGFYVDIGCYDSIFASNTLNLHSMGWQGINIDASPSRLPRFFYSRPGEASMNYAIGDSNQYVTLYELSEDSSSTLSKKVKDMVQSYKPVTDEVKVASISMKDLCERFFYRRPLFLNLDIQGYGSKALMSNDWSNPKCRPEVIFSQINDQTKQSGLPLPETVLKQRGYKKWKGTVGLNQIFITSQLYQKYEKKYAQGQKLTNQKAIYNFGFVAYNFVANILKLTTIIVPHHEPQTDSVYYHFAKYKQLVDLNYVNEYSNRITTTKMNRPIIVMNYDPEDSYLVLRNQNYEVNQFMVEVVKFYNITVTKDDGGVFSVYVFDHSKNNTARPRVLITNLSKAVPPNMVKAEVRPTLNDIVRELTNGSSTNTTIDNKLLARVIAMLNESTTLTGKTSKNIEFRSRELMSTLLTNHYYDKAQFETVLNRLTNLEKASLESKDHGQTVTSLEGIEDLREDIETAVRNQVLVLFAIFFAMLIINVVVCVASDMKDGDGKRMRRPRKLTKEEEVDKRKYDEYEIQIQHQEYEVHADGHAEDGKENVEEEDQEEVSVDEQEQDQAQPPKKAKHGSPKRQSL